jgi:hypothetical protein
MSQNQPVNSVADGHVRRMRWNAPDQWIWSPEPTHEALIDRDDWQRLQALTTTQVRASRPTDVSYLLRGRVFCATCKRRMTGQRQARRRSYYRCELRRARTGLTIDDHPADVYVRVTSLAKPGASSWQTDTFTDIERPGRKTHSKMIFFPEPSSVRIATTETASASSTGGWCRARATRVKVRGLRVDGLGIRALALVRIRLVKRPHSPTR